MLLTANLRHGQWLLFQRRIAVQVCCVFLAATGIGFELTQNVILPVWLPNIVCEYSAHGVFAPLDVIATVLRVLLDMRSLGRGRVPLYLVVLAVAWHIVGSSRYRQAFNEKPAEHFA